MTKKKFSIKIANDTNREKVFAEIYYNEEEWAEISQEGETPLITLFPPLQGKYWELPLDETLEAIKEAKIRINFRYLQFCAIIPTDNARRHCIVSLQKFIAFNIR